MDLHKANSKLLFWLAGGAIVGLLLVVMTELLIEYSIFEILLKNATVRRSLGVILGASLGFVLGTRRAGIGQASQGATENVDAPTPEHQKLLAEARKLEKESLAPKWYFRWGPLASGFAGLAVVGTLFYSLLTFKEQRIARQEERFQAAIESLGSSEPAMRIVGANMVSRFLAERRFHADAISLLAQIFLLEEKEDVVHALRVGLQIAGKKYPEMLLPDLSSIKEGVRSKIIHHFSKKGNILDQINLLQDKLYMLAHIEKDLSKKNLALTRANFQCWRKLEADFVEAELSDSIFRYADLYGGNFMGSNLQRSLFNQSNLSYVRFTDADLKEAKFTGANLFNARFERAKNIDPDSFKDSSWAWAHFDAGIKEKLVKHFGGGTGRKDLRKEGRDKCDEFRK